MNLNDVEVREITLEQLKYAIRKVMPESSLSETSEIWMAQDHMLNSMVMELRAAIYAEKFEDEKELEFTFSFERPSTWWDVLKEKHMPEWFVTRFPVRYTKERLTRKRKVSFMQLVKYPNMNIVARDSRFVRVYESSINPVSSKDDE